MVTLHCMYHLACIVHLYQAHVSSCRFKYLLSLVKIKIKYQALQYHDNNREEMDAMAVFSDVVVLPMMRRFDFRYSRSCVCKIESK